MLFFYLMMGLSQGAAALECWQVRIHVTAMSDAEFQTMVSQSLAWNVNRVPWLTTEAEPKIVIGQNHSLETIIDTVACCGLSRVETRNIFMEKLRGQTEGEISLHDYLNTAYGIAAKKANINCVQNCVSTALMHAHTEFVNLEKLGTNRERIQHFFRRVEELSALTWGDIFVLRQKDDDVAHVILNHANGLVTHKPGMGPARVEPLKRAIGFYSSYNLQRWEIWRRRSESPVDLYNSYSPAPPMPLPFLRRVFWWLPFPLW